MALKTTGPFSWTGIISALLAAACGSDSRSAGDVSSAEPMEAGAIRTSADASSPSNEPSANASAKDAEDNSEPNELVADAGTVKEPIEPDNQGGGLTDASVQTPSGELVPCDILSPEDSCAPALCAGTPASGYYCRTACDADSNVGDACETDGICLKTRTPGADDDSLVCVIPDDCELVSGSGCSEGESCVYLSIQPRINSCVPVGSNGPWESCDASSGNGCGIGLACLGSDLEDGEPGQCTPFCNADTLERDDCELCVELAPGLGTCAQCAVLDDQCPSGSQCHPVSEALGGVCIEYGPGTPGDECGYDSSSSCQEGFLCMEEELDGPDINVCRQTCDSRAPQCGDINGETSFCFDIAVIEPGVAVGQLGFCTEDLPGPICSPGNNIACPEGDTCIEPQNEEFGFCLGGCDPTLANCADNHTCLPFVDGQPYADAFTGGSGVCGEGCTIDSDCPEESGVCLHLEGLNATGLCGAECTPPGIDTDASVGPSADCDALCIPTPEEPSRGACLTGPSICDLSEDNGCAFGRCTPVTDSVESGVCLLPCFVQSPNACLYDEQMLGSCIGFADERLHEGVCLGQPEPCDPLAQTGCDSSQACQAAGGGAFGGGALVCSDPGEGLLDDECESNDDCQAGLLCIEGEQPQGKQCRPYCDLDSPECSSGTCSDISVEFYLPVRTIGGCIGLSTL